MTRVIAPATRRSGVIRSCALVDGTKPAVLIADARDDWTRALAEELAVEGIATEVTPDGEWLRSVLSGDEAPGRYTLAVVGPTLKELAPLDALFLAWSRRAEAGRLATSRVLLLLGVSRDTELIGLLRQRGVSDCIEAGAEPGEVASRVELFLHENARRCRRVAFKREATLYHDVGRIRGETVDISASGVAISAPSPDQLESLRIGTRVKVKIYLQPRWMLALQSFGGGNDGVAEDESTVWSAVQQQDETSLTFSCRVRNVRTKKRLLRKPSLVLGLEYDMMDERTRRRLDEQLREIGAPQAEAPPPGQA